MGTNYYCRYNYCSECGSYKELHIGKSSGGCLFHFRIHPEQGINDIGDWLAFLSKDKVVIYDEYEKYVSLKKLVFIITNREWPDRTQSMGVPSQKGPWDYNNYVFS